MRIISIISGWLKSRSVQVGLVVVLAIFALVFLGNYSSSTDVTQVDSRPIVHLTTAAEYGGGQSLSLIGTVRPLAEAKITSERAGRVVSVRTTLGAEVQAGEILVTLENASEQAAVLQAEGVYEAALAVAAQSNVSVDQAKNSLETAKKGAISTFQSAYNTTNNVVRNSIDVFFANPDAHTPGLLISGKGYATALNTERIAHQTSLLDWQTKVKMITSDSDLYTELDYAKQSVQRTIKFVDTFLTVFSIQDEKSSYDDAEIQGFIATFTTLRSNLIASESAIDTSVSVLKSAADGLRSAELAASGGQVSAADAQVKQALGSLKAAHANLAKTIMSTPISGTVNHLSARTGDFIGAYTQVATVANNGAQEIVTYLSERDRSLLAVGDVVSIEQTSNGTVTEIAPAVDNATQKIEVRIATENPNLLSGDTVRLTKEIAIANITEVKVPLSAVKFTASDGYVFTVDDGRLVAHPVTLGPVRGGSVVVTSGLATDIPFVVDVRGLVEGDTISVQN